jgi:hypothetical protein
MIQGLPEWAYGDVDTKFFDKLALQTRFPGLSSLPLATRKLPETTHVIPLAPLRDQQKTAPEN